MSLQIAYPLFEKFPIEHLLFEKHLNQEYYVECYDDLPDDFEEFKKTVKNKKHDTLSYNTDDLGFPFLRILAHTYFKNDIFLDGIGMDSIVDFGECSLQIPF